jgi:hypothetical protein
MRDGLPRPQGFVLQVPTESPVLNKGSSPTPNPPFFVESWQLLDDGRDIRIHIYWMFNAESGLDAKYALFHRLRNAIVELSLKQVLRCERLVAVRGERVILVPGEPLIGLSLGTVRRDLKRHFFHLLEYVHEGDWEGLAVVTHGSSPVGVHFRTHHDGEMLRWSSACDTSRWSGVPPGRPLAQMAPLSHACYPPGCTQSDDDPLPGPSDATEYVDMADTLLPASLQDWYGFGGAWGAPRLPDVFDEDVGINPADELTGPLGPCPPRAQIELARVWSLASALI